MASDRHASRRDRRDLPAAALPIERVRLRDGTTHDVPVQREKGIDLRFGLDVVRIAATLNVAVIFSQDQDLVEVAHEVRDISRTRDCWLKVVCRFFSWTACKFRARNRPTGSGWTANSTMPVSIPGIIDRVVE